MLIYNDPFEGLNADLFYVFKKNIKYVYLVFCIFITHMVIHKIERVVGKSMLPLLCIRRYI